MKLLNYTNFYTSRTIFNIYIHSNKNISLSHLKRIYMNTYIKLVLVKIPFTLLYSRVSIVTFQ